MLFAIKEGEKILATSNQKGCCIGCYAPVKAYCGEIYKWHWRHESNVICDEWFEPETKWHLGWKELFNRKNTEVRICKDEKWHIADIYTNSEVVIELQYSSIDKQTIRAREAFYGERMLWLLNKRQMNIVPMELDSFYIDRPLPFSIYFDIKELGFPAWIADFLSYTPTEKLKRSLLENGFVFDTLLKKYFKISSMRTCRKFGFSADISGSLVDEIRIFSRGISKQNPKLKKFSLIKSQKTWSDSGRNIFIDKSSNDILWIKSFKCNKYGIVEVLKKQDFIDKYTATKQ